MAAWELAGRPRLARIGACALSCVLVACGGGEDPARPAAAGGASAVDAGLVAPDAALDPGAVQAWPMYGGDLAGTRANTSERAITAANVATLERVWQHTGSSNSSTPAVVDGVVYLPSWDGSVRALAVADGRELWATELPRAIDSSPAVTATQVLVSDTAGSVHALERGSGRVQWSVQVDPHPQTHLWSSPIAIEDAGIVVIGVASSEEVAPGDEVTFRGSVVALGLVRGDERWRVPTTDEQAGEGAGVAVWATVVVDEARKQLFVGTGNQYAPPAGPLGDALLAIDYERGTLEWSHQFLAEDVFSLPFPTGPDFDIGASATLLRAGGRDLVGVGIKSGLYVALDRDLGEPVWMTQVSPGGFFGGILSSPAFGDGLIYVAGNDAEAGRTLVVALDAESGEPVWQAEHPYSTFGGLAFAAGVVYVGALSSEIRALDARTGALLFSDPTPDIAGSPVVSHGTLLVPWGYQITLTESAVGAGGVIAYRPR